MEVRFLGATHEVTGSCTYINAGGRNILVDCGMEQGRDVFENTLPPVNANEIDYVFLTHAHVDHSGNLPLLYKQGFRGTVIATKETANLCEIMLRDCAFIQESEAKFRTRKAKRAGKEAVEPLFTINDAEGVLELFRPCSYLEVITVDEGISLRFTDIGHLLGSAAIEIWLTEEGITKKIVFSGDVGNTNQPIINDPSYVKEADFVVCESTYGTRLHNAKRQNSIEVLASVIQRTLDRGGNVIIPSFAVGRTQEMLYFIREIKEKGLVQNHHNFPVYVDSPLANEATGIYLQCDTSCLDDEFKAVMKDGNNPLWFDGLNTTVTSDESRQLNMNQTPKVIISASGMCEAGRVCHHLKYNLWRKECTLLFVGYQAEGTLGRKIHDGAESVRLFGDEIAVNCEVTELIGVSGHADKEGLLSWLKGFEKKPQLIFVNHGDDEAVRDFKDAIEQEIGVKAFAPFSGTAYDLLKGEFIEITEGVPIKQRNSRERQFESPLQKTLVSSARKLLALAEGSAGIPNKDMRKLTEEIERLIKEYRR